VEIISKTTREEKVTDFEALFASGSSYVATLREGDVIEHVTEAGTEAEVIRVFFKMPPEERIFYKGQLAGYSTRERVIEWPSEEPKPAPATDDTESMVDEVVSLRVGRGTKVTR